MTGLTSTHKRSMIFPAFFLACYEEKILLPRMPGHRRLGKVNFESFTFLYFQNLFIKKSYVFEWPVSCTLKQEHKIGIIFLKYIDRKKLTETSARSASTGNLQIASPKSWWSCPYCRLQFAFHRDSTPLNRPWNCKKSAHKSTQTERKKLKKTYISECPVTGHSQKCILKSLTFTSFSSMYLSTTSCIFECSISRALQTGT